MSSAVPGGGPPELEQSRTLDMHGGAALAHDRCGLKPRVPLMRSADARQVAWRCALGYTLRLSFRRHRACHRQGATLFQRRFQDHLIPMFRLAHISDLHILPCPDWRSAN